MHTVYYMVCEIREYFLTELEEILQTLYIYQNFNLKLH